MIIIKKRAKYLAKIRNYFSEIDVMEVDTPLAYDYGVTDPFIDVFDIMTSSGKKYLQSSPEYAMKRLLSAGSGSIYQICKAFRDEPTGINHSSEFTMLEWYRVGIDYFELMKEMETLFVSIKPNIEFIYLSYQEAFERYLGFNPHRISLEELQIFTQQTVGNIQGLDIPTAADCLDILFSYKIENKLNETNKLYFIYDYTIHQSALSRIVNNADQELVAARFEVFYNSLELANGYYELLDKQEHINRFNDDLSIRNMQSKPYMEIDTPLLDSLDSIPECSGVALGIDRLIMALEGVTDINDLSIF